MNPRRTALRAAGLASLALAVSGCATPIARPGQSGAHPVSLPAGRSSVLLVITDPRSAAAWNTTATLVEATARPEERLVILSDRGGQTLASATAPAPPSVPGPAPASPLPAGATSFQKAEHARALRQYQAALARDRAAVQSRERSGLATWARSVIRQADSPSAAQNPAAVDTGGGLRSAAAVLSSLRQLGTGSGTPVAVAITGVSPAAAQSVPEPVTGLQGTAVTVDGFPGGSGAESAWQSSLLQSGAARVTMLGPATQDELPSVVGRDLDGTSPDTAATIRFGLGQYTLSAAAERQLRQVLRLLTTRYSRSSITITGYTDELPAPGGNLRLSELRARSVADWLSGHGISPQRLQAYGYGAADSVAVNTADGQPLDRRAVIIIDPVVCGNFAGACTVPE